MAMIEAARERGVFFMEAFMYRCHPQTAKLTELRKEGAIGEVRMIKASFGFDAVDTIDASHRLVNPAMGSGEILDVGCYPVSMSRLIAGVAGGKPLMIRRMLAAAESWGEPVSMNGPPQS